MGALGYTSRTLCGANGTGIGVSGCSHCVVSFMGLQTEFPILVCDLATGTDAIIGTDVLGSVLLIPWTLRMASCLQMGCFTPVTPTGFCSFRSCFYSGPLLDTTLFRGCAALFCTEYRWSSDAIQWFIRGTNTVRKEYWSDCGQNSGGSVAMESFGPRVKFQSGYRHGGSVLRGRNDSSSFCYSVHYGATPPATG